jgi:ABC-type transport system involved in multi-copper enzyme maturation permease subunit
MLRIIASEWLKISRNWLPRFLLVFLILIVVIQVNSTLSLLEELEAKASVEEDHQGDLSQMAGSDRERADWLKHNLSYPAVIGFTAILATQVGIFFLILIVAVLGGEDFTRRTLSSILARGVGRGRYLLARCMIFWLAAGVAILTITLLAIIGGPIIHYQIHGASISLQGLGEALLTVLRAWLICLPFIVATLFWAVLARNAGPALGVGMGLHFLEFFNGQVLPLMAIAIERGADVPQIYRSQVSLFSVTLGFNADVVLYWGSPFMKSISTGNTVELGYGTLLSTAPLRASAILVGFTILFMSLVVWILRRRDLTYGA